ncbi:diguanylate cyclase [Mycolicibacterium sp. 22603]|uniref:GGDEF domain-containing protein n=1 Tax=Mycolicibacterium sp. 22603 TaxID=3453950 RepID=UPI003F87496A
MGDTGAVAMFGRWWRQPSRYDWLVGLVRDSGYGRLARFGVGASCVAIGAWPILMAFSAQGVVSPVIRIVTVLCGVLAILLGCWWFAGWPTYRQSRFIVIVLNASIALTCVLYVLDDSPVTGTLAFALTATYVAGLHTLQHLAIVLGLATVPIVMRIFSEALAGDLYEGLADGVLRLTAVTVVPITLRLLLQLLSDAAVDSDIDPLTGLANRRGLLRSVGQLVGTATGGRRLQISLTMLDIDDFKAINDTHGHATGDGVLVTLSRLMRVACADDAVIARVGGEEFAIVAIEAIDDARLVAERLRGQFERAPARFTVSIGIAGAMLERGAPVDTIALTERLLDAADRAMYDAKRAGGDRVHVAAG